MLEACFHIRVKTWLNRKERILIVYVEDFLLQVQQNVGVAHNKKPQDEPLHVQQVEQEL